MREAEDLQSSKVDQLLDGFGTQWKGREGSRMKKNSLEVPR